MDDLTSLFSSQSGDKELVDKFITLLDRQTDHKLAPHLMLGLLGMFNMLSMISVVHHGVGSGIKEVAAQSSGSEENQQPGQDLNNMLSGLLGTQSSGQPDLMGILGNVASKKKINPGLLISLLGLLNNQSSTNKSRQEEPELSAAKYETVEEPGEILPPDNTDSEKNEKKNL